MTTTPTPEGKTPASQPSPAPCINCSDAGCWYCGHTGSKKEAEQQSPARSDMLEAGCVPAELEAVEKERDSLKVRLAEAAPSGDDLHKSAQDLLNCCDGLPIDTDEATAEVLTAFDRTRSRLKKALARRATAGNAAPTEAQAFEFLAEYDEIRGDEGVYTLTSDDKWVIRNFLIEMFDDVASPAAPSNNSQQ